MMHSFSRYQARRGPLTQVLALIAGALFLTAAFFVGLAFIAIAFGAAAILSIAVAIRSWWLGRKHRQGPDGKRDPDIIAGEYRIVEIRTERRDD